MKNRRRRKNLLLLLLFKKKQRKFLLSKRTKSPNNWVNWKTLRKKMKRKSRKCQKRQPLIMPILILLQGMTRIAKINKRQKIKRYQKIKIRINKLIRAVFWITRMRMSQSLTKLEMKRTVLQRKKLLWMNQKKKIRKLKKRVNINYSQDCSNLLERKILL